MSDNPPKPPPEAQPPKPEGQQPESSAQSGVTAAAPGIPLNPALLAQLLGGRASLPYLAGPMMMQPGLRIGVPPPLSQAQQTVQLWQGQYPPPEAVEHYEKILPGAFDRMIRMAEQLQAAQIEETKRAQELTQADTKRGHWLGFCATIAAIAGAVSCTLFGWPWVGVAFVSVPVMAVAKALVESTKRESSSELLRAAGSELSVAAPPQPNPAK